MDWNLLLNVAALAAIVLGATVIGSRRRLETTISDFEKANDALTRRVDSLEQDKKGLIERANRAERSARECAEAAKKLEGRYEELQKYTAREAVGRFEELMAEHRAQVALRHEAMIGHLGQLDSGVKAHGELLLKVVELQSKVAQKVGVPMNS